MRRGTFDIVLVGVVLVFAFLASSFAVRNSDFWLHLAGGRLLAEGRYTFGVDPFAFTTENQYWANHAWFFDWLLYLLHQQFAGAVLVVLKALIISLLAFVLLRLRRSECGRGWPTACTLMAIAALSPRLLLHSATLSYVFLGLTLGLLWRPRPRAAPLRQQLRHDAPLLLLFLLWVNVDGWFLLGPLVAGLFWLGDRIAPDSERRTPGWLGLVGLTVCVLNPHHVHAFTLPVELMPLPDALRRDVRFESLYTTPWRMIRYYHPLSGINVANSAYLGLLVVGVLSFLLNIRNAAGWRVLVWVTFAGLSAWVERTIPFFAVVAAPITALNLQDALIRFRFGVVLRGVSHLVLVMSALVLIGLAWAGWLQGFQDTGRHVAWSVQPDGSLRRMAKKLHLWQQQGNLRGRGFLAHPSLVPYCAWYCPEEKGYLDPRLRLFHDVADSYEAICRALNPGLASPNRSANADWRALLRTADITHVVLYDPALPRLLPALNQLADDNSDWSLLAIEGQALLVGWRDGERMLPERMPPFDAERLAFTQSSASEETMIPEVPVQGPGRGPALDNFWSHFGQALPPSSWPTESAGVLLSYFEVRAPREHRQQAQRTFAWAAALPVLPIPSAGSGDGLWRVVGGVAQAPPAVLDVQQQSPALPLLAVRCGRAALAQNPDDGNASLYLGRAYLALASRTSERSLLNRVIPLVELRHIQIAAALTNALRRNPHSLAAHEALAVLYKGRGFLDAELVHRHAVLRLTRELGPLSGEDAAAYARRLEQEDRLVAALERRVRDLKNEFALRTQTLGSEPYRKAEIALNMGLVQLALEDILMPSSMVLLGGEGVRLQVRLQLMLGRVDPVRTQLQSADWLANKANLGYVTLGADNPSAPPYRLPAYEWLMLCLATADGDYERAEAFLTSLYDEAESDVKKALRLEPTQPLEPIVKELQSKLLREIGLEFALSAASPPGFLRTIAQRVRVERTQQLLRFAVPAQELEKDGMLLQLIAGMLALERGQPQTAEMHFQEALSRSPRLSTDAAFGGEASLAAMYLWFLKMPLGHADGDPK